MVNVLPVWSAFADTHYSEELCAIAGAALAAKHSEARRISFFISISLYVLLPTSIHWTSIIRLVPHDYYPGAKTLRFPAHLPARLSSGYAQLSLLIPARGAKLRGPSIVTAIFYPVYPAKRLFCLITYIG